MNRKQTWRERVEKNHCKNVLWQRRMIFLSDLSCHKLRKQFTIGSLEMSWKSSENVENFPPSDFPMTSSRVKFVSTSCAMLFLMPAISMAIIWTSVSRACSFYDEARVTQIDLRKGLCNTIENISLVFNVILIKVKDMQFAASSKKSLHNKSLLNTQSFAFKLHASCSSWNSLHCF